MSIWEHQDIAPLAKAEKNPPAECLFCKTALRVLDERRVCDSGSDGVFPWSHTDVASLLACDLCGWWVVHRFFHAWDSMYDEGAIGGAHGLLRKLSLRDIGIPIEELRRYLIARYPERFQLDPRKFEDVVGGVFGDLGFDVFATAFSGDHGIDLLAIAGEGDEVLGVQVKRYRGRIEAEQIRAFAGALVLRGLTRGVFVTTSKYRSGAEQTARRFQDRGIAVDLWDGKKFLDALRISQRPLWYSAEDPSAPFVNAWTAPDKLPKADTWCHDYANG